MGPKRRKPDQSIQLFPEYIKNRFKIIKRGNIEKDYYPPYNILLTEYFPAYEGYSVAPVAQPVGERDSIDFTVEYVVECNAKPVMFLEIKAPDDFEKDSKRQEADEQMRRRFRQLIDDCPDFINKLYGLSAFGTKMAYYTLDTEERKITPLKIKDDDIYIKDTAPKKWWDSDMLQQGGEQRFLEVVEEIKARCRDFSGRRI
ncbi:hypothetical protein CONCODRAFT_44957 [Conidiobolus coronatus NRRL 28638]|uniref:Uncharacterized protein n=1 Tax=Conidiobolus coronatus (strain ATCC 28846 / CBS 209.66 / NRRL 28638) TaxID=796925 RepID=A0A137NQ38_CONC2|nr:hypothetical protein CONCODRAFT_44957 [Conidiobolus coronatus NRRL 28638]|eukprot:KXN64859.1 hypothetical protein CONCODRAFT_44957 [Conidiobolus coronatus NRRL 28638]